jgi:hypothetical protein
MNVGEVGDLKRRAQVTGNAVMGDLYPARLDPESVGAERRRKNKNDDNDESPLPNPR